MTTTAFPWTSNNADIAARSGTQAKNNTRTNQLVPQSTDKHIESSASRECKEIGSPAVLLLQQQRRSQRWAARAGSALPLTSQP
jgi:hypothetical protein